MQFQVNLDHLADLSLEEINSWTKFKRKGTDALDWLYLQKPAPRLES
jgi:hypothetical protein